MTRPAASRGHRPKRRSAPTGRSQKGLGPHRFGGAGRPMPLRSDLTELARVEKVRKSETGKGPKV
jgi:hypothetical protein